VTLRLVSGAVMLALLALRSAPTFCRAAPIFGGVLSLLAYGEAFTFAYISLGAATGALILFATVQLTLAIWATLRGTPLSWRDRLGSPHCLCRHGLAAGARRHGAAAAAGNFS